MINKVNLMLALLMAVVLQSCGQKEKQTASGLTYTVLEKGDGEVIKDSLFLVLNMSYKDDNDSTWMTTAEKEIPAIVPKNDSIWSSSQGSIEEILNELSVGDSVSFQISIADFFANSVKSPVPPTVNKEGTLTFNIGVEKAMTQEEFMAWRQEMMQKQQAKMAEEADAQLETDVKIIEEYLAENNIEAEKTESGLYYVIKEEGSGDKPEVGETVSVNYAGHVLNGPYFDTSIESVAKEQGIYNEDRPNGYGPLEFPLGKGRVIKGWDEGVALLNEGGKATLYIPSGLAYGPRQRSEEITANAILVFDVELVDIKSADDK
ncbi:FKBP-type peptidyl-prolyl cis-trans isomerase [Fulvivirga sediminis]|uniref:Peptidyl-prolyl cis-trans isomerase n=1 Tax=Fulvivirga sediminis TaxID=2803949 RepID=A0A937K113_9BACT|nr:FKBP-type peptidyl-prolyl cis-trans isomerase [Fulvivirga sediminis]MBL3656966.1 FKBP-type peptidyl-prolyl cis-trans isomerase [Fulvivirga sediminis]